MLKTKKQKKTYWKRRGGGFVASYLRRDEYSSLMNFEPADAESESF